MTSAEQHIEQFMDWERGFRGPETELSPHVTANLTLLESQLGMTGTRELIGLGDGLSDTTMRRAMFVVHFLKMLGKGQKIPNDLNPFLIQVIRWMLVHRNAFNAEMWIKTEMGGAQLMDCILRDIPLPNLSEASKANRPKRGLKFQGSECEFDGTFTRYASNGGCVECKRVASKQRSQAFDSLKKHARRSVVNRSLEPRS